MHSNQVTVATMTWARSAEEDALLRRALTSLAACGMPLVIADAGVSTSFLRFLERLPHASVVVPSDRGLISQISTSLEAAGSHRSRFILYTEPDKQSFFERGLCDFVRAAGNHPDAGVILASRSPESLLTFPRMQRYAEGVINNLCGELVGVTGDFSYGPFVMDSALVPFVAGLDPRLGWGWRHFIFRTAHRQGRRIALIAGDYPCPEQQRMEDDAERSHRLRQLSQNLLGLID